MKVVVVNNEYQQAGGEEEVVRNEIAMLSSRSHAVTLVSVSNKQINTIWCKFKTAWKATYSDDSRTRLRRELTRIRPDIVHVHNFFPLLSPSVYDACREVDVPVVQTLHNYRIICPGALLMRRETICEQCVSASAYRSVVRHCYRNSWLGTLAVARMVDHHRRRGTWREKVDGFIALTEFAKEKFVEGGLPEARIAVKPNFLMLDPGQGRGKGGYGLFVGRLSHEKGLTVLLKAWERLGRRITLKIAGAGPLAKGIERASERLLGVQYLGYQDREEVTSLMKEASFLVFPSVWYEGLPMAIIQAYAVGLPVIGSNIGVLSEVIQNTRTGLHFQPNDHEDLCRKVEWLLSYPGQLSRMRDLARAEYLERYTLERNYDLLMAIYQQAIHRIDGEGKSYD